jgi:signal transduction histidine kinase
MSSDPITPITLADLRPIDLFDDLEDDQLREWVTVCAVAQFDPGETIAEQQQAPEGVLLLLEGTARTLVVDEGRVEPVGRQQAPTWIGAIAVLTEGNMGVRLQALSACRVAIVPAAEFRRLALAHPAVHRRVMRQVEPVMSRITALEQNRERLASLGTMAAGLAHELNNPAAAARRTAAELADVLEAVNSALARFVELGVERAQAAELLALQREAVERADGAAPTGALDAADAEDQVVELLEGLGVAEPWRLAEPLAAAGVDRAWLNRVHELAGPATDAALRWVAATLTADRLIGELQESTKRMSDLVGAVKSYAYMDRGELVEVDLHEGLDTTLTVLGYKLKHTKIDVVRDYDPAMPKLRVRGSGLTQVWTNLLDNAIDALGNSGTITIATRTDGDSAVVAISDDGPGIPADARDRIFDPFFTTKDVGHGTGLGLATARGIVVDRHDGSLSVKSQPGETVFRVRLPITQR